MWGLSADEPWRSVSTYRLDRVIIHSQSSHVDQALLLKRLKPVPTSYNRELCCMDGTRGFLLNKIITWATAEPSQNEGNTYWVYGSPGIGKTTLAHSISKRLSEGMQLTGAFFCRRDDQDLNEAGNILPTLIYQLAVIFPPFRSIVVKHLRDNPNVAPGSMKGSLLLQLIRSMPRHPMDNVVFVIDALDETGGTLSRPGILRALTDAAAQVPWLRIVITSRPEIDIQRFFDAPAHSSHMRYDLAADREASADLRTFAQSEFNFVATRLRLPTPWPEESLFEKAISRANGLFIFIKTVVLALEYSNDPIESLNATLQYSTGTGLKPLYGLYLSILKSRIPPNDGEFQRVIGVLLATAPYCSLCRETIAELAGVRPNIVRKWVDDLSPLLYEDEGANNGVRVRHLSISDFFISSECPSDSRVDPRDANIQLGIACLTTMIDQLRFNICNLEDSRLANADIEDLQSRIEQNISDALQYSCLHWSNHLCSTRKNDNQHGQELLKKFFEGCYPLFWIEVLSLMGMVSTCVPSIRGVMLTWLKVSVIQLGIICISNIILA